MAIQKLGPKRSTNSKTVMRVVRVASTPQPYHSNLFQEPSISTVSQATSPARIFNATMAKAVEIVVPYTGFVQYSNHPDSR